MERIYGVPVTNMAALKRQNTDMRQLAERGVEITVLQDERCVALMRRFIAAHPALWNEDIGVEDD